MKKYILFSLIIFAFLLKGNAQQVIDGNFTVENVNKKYSLYIPSDYDANTPHQLMLGLHPLNPSRWDGASWRDTLINFSESNNLIFVSPDGGPDGRIDDPIDTTFTSALLDSIHLWYNINHNEQYIMGFSWGGKTTYTYGLRRTEQFAGYIAIGAAINGTSEISDIISNAEHENFYLVHGSQDAVSTRYTPLLNGLRDNNACVESNLLSGVGHTIDFPNRNQILTNAFEWVKNNNCGTSSTTSLTKFNFLDVFPNPSNGSFVINNLSNFNLAQFEIVDITGAKVNHTLDGNSISISEKVKGLFFLRGQMLDGSVFTQKVLVK